MSLLEIIFCPWKAQSKLKLLASAEREAEAHWQELTKLRAEMVDAETELTALENEMAWLQDGPGVKKVDGGWVCRFYPLNVQPVWPTLREAIRYGRESE